MDYEEDSFGGVFGDVDSAVRDIPDVQTGTGASPDGLGAYAMPGPDPNQPAANTTGQNYEAPPAQEPGHTPYALPPSGAGALQRPQYPAEQQLAGQSEWLEPTDASPEARLDFPHSAMAGFGPCHSRISCPVRVLRVWYAWSIPCE